MSSRLSRALRKAFSMQRAAPSREARGFPVRVRGGRASSHPRQLRPLKSGHDRQFPRDLVDDGAGNEDRQILAGPPLQYVVWLPPDPGPPADARADIDAD